LEIQVATVAALSCKAFVKISSMMPKGMVLVLLCGLDGVRLVAAADVPLPSSAVADKVIVLKSERKLMLMNSNKVLKTYRIALGTDPLGRKNPPGRSQDSGRQLPARSA
jgi:hypothetical protein